MAINLARLGTIQRDNIPDYNPFEESRARARAKQDADLAALNLKKGGIDLANAQRLQTEAETAAKEKIATRDVMKNYIQGRNFGETAPVGVVNPSFLAKPEMGPQTQADSISGPKRDLGNLERETAVNLANINPETSETFRIGRKTETESADDRARRIAKEQADATRQAQTDTFDQGYKNRTLGETERHNQQVEALTRMGILQKGKTAAAKTQVTPEKLSKIKASKQGAIADLDATADVVDRLIGSDEKGIKPHPGLYGLTGTSGAIPIDWPGGKTKDAEALRQQLVAKAAFSELQKMRANSPTGGALGAVSDKENLMLQNAAAALQRGQSPDQFRKNLENYRTQLRISKQHIEDAYKQDFGDDLTPDASGQPPVDNTQDPEYQRLLYLRSLNGGQ